MPPDAGKPRGSVVVTGSSTDIGTAAFAGFLSDRALDRMIARATGS